MKLLCLIILSIAFFTSSLVKASDKNGHFAVKGIGGIQCSNFTDAKDDKDSIYLQFGGWIEGYISAKNEHLTNIYDIAPWQTSETLATIIYTECKKNPKMPFAKVILKLTEQLSKNSLNLKSTLIKITNGKFSTHLPEIIYIKSIKKLSNLNFINDNPKRSDINKAFLAYQKSKQLPLTGLPDQYTLWNLLAE